MMEVTVALERMRPVTIAMTKLVPAMKLGQTFAQVSFYK